MKPAGALLGASALVLSLVASGCGTTCDSTVRVTGMPVIAAGSFDGVEADQAAHRLYLADRTTQGVDVVDISATAPRFAGTVVLGGTPNGLALAPDQHRVYVGMDGGTLAVIDADTMKAAGTIKADATTADLVDYSPRTKDLYVGSGTDVVVVDTVTGQVKQRLAAGANVEQPRYDPADGKLYVTTPRTDTLLQIDLASGKVSRRYVVTKCGPSGLAINPARQLAMLACGSSVAFVDLRTGAHDVTRAVQGGDIVTYDAGADRFVIGSPHDAGDSAVGVFTGGGAFVGSVPATPGTHAGAYDDAHQAVYAPGKGGLMSFAPEACAPPPDWLKFVGGLSLFAVPLLAGAVFLFYYGRTRERRRLAPRTSGQTYEDLVQEDLAFERERMRALEDGMFGPDAAP